MQSRILQCAAEIVGGAAQLCQRLEVSEPELQRWLSNEEVCPLPTCLQAVDIVIESERGFSAIFSSKPPADDGSAR